MIKIPPKHTKVNRTGGRLMREYVWDTPELMEKARLERREEEIAAMDWTPEELRRIRRGTTG